ncbi:hypothetical protein DMC61_27805 [Amycolatopsis sp. WAC 04169]|uniref:hypothetical protein n=1 Tax=Amycolatopsis sp. WAC 04169 TaxID=2203197 RepID=UPI000F76D885|nr:hypothetical protein [Amycolatopsis sp. WAC 04169]RSN25582.1 hypothetical protein DMC61_27805 [Amycolatopsis sp. WAC 04169]
MDSNSAGSVYTHACQDRNNNQKWNNYAPGKFKNKATGLCLAAGTSSTTNKYFTNVSTGLCLHNGGGQAEVVGLRVCRAGTALWTVTKLRS